MTGKDGAKTPTGDDDEQSTGVDEIILNLVQVASMYEILPLQEECEVSPCGVYRKLFR